MCLYADTNKAHKILGWTPNHSLQSGLNNTISCIEIMKDEPLISIIMNCYNGEKYLNEAIESILSQTYSNWELIFFDNLSIDNSSSIINSFKDERIKYFYLTYIMKLIRSKDRSNYSNGEYLSFLDVDDWWKNDKLEKQIPFFKDQSVGVVCSNYIIHDYHH